MRIEEIPINRITLPAYLHRLALDPVKLQSLANSIRDVGLQQPIGLDPEGDHYMLAFGHRRLEAHRLLGRTHITAKISEPGALASGEVLTWTENLEREDPSPIEQARALTRMHTAGGLTIATIAKLLKRSEDWVEARLALLTMPAELIDHVHKGALPISHALTLARVTDEGHRCHLVAYAMRSGASHAVLKDWVAQWLLDLEAGRLSEATLPALPIAGETYVVTVPCITCGIPHPAVELRIVRICPPCIDNVIQATAEWRKAAAPASAPVQPRDYAPE